MSKQEIFYTSPNGAGGDIIPFYDNGEYRLFFLGKGWTCVSTKDHLHFHDEYKTGIYGGTGSVLKVDGVYHMFYCKFTFRPTCASMSAMPPARIWSIGWSILRRPSSRMM